MKPFFLFLIFAVFTAGCTQAPPPQEPPQNMTEEILQLPSDELDQALQELEITEDLPETREFNLTARQWDFTPGRIEVNRGDTVILHVKSVDVTHGIWIPEFDINKKLEPGKTVTMSFVADRAGTFPLICSVYCGDGHFQMKGEIIVK